MPDDTVVVDESPKKPALRLDLIVPIVLFSLALLLRLVGISWGLKNDLHSFSYHPDEPDIFFYSQSVEPAKGKFTPGFYNYGTLYLSALRVASDMTATYTGGIDPQKPESLTDFMSRVHLVGRLLSALAGAGLVWVVYLLIRRFAGVFGAAMGAGLVAVAPGLVVHSRYQTVDVLSTFFIGLSTYYAIKLLATQTDTEALKYAVISGVFAGLSAGTKYTGGLAILTLLAVLLLARRKSAVREGAAGLGALILTFLVTTPGVLLDSAKFMRDFRYEMLHTSTGHGIEFAGTSNGFVFHLGNLVVGVGGLLSLLAIGGLFVACARKHVWAWALLAFFVPYYLLIGRAEVKFMRYTFPLTIGMAAGFGWLMSKAQERKGNYRALVGAGIVALGGLDSGGLRAAATYTAWMAKEDPRDQAANYLKEAAKSDSSAVVGYASDPWFYSVPLFRDSSDPRRVPFTTRMERLDAAATPKLAFYRPTDSDPFAFDVRLVTETKPEYITLSSFEIAPVERLSHLSGLDRLDKLQADRYVEFMQKLAASYRLERLFGGGNVSIHDMEYVQPMIYVWKRKTSS